MKKVVIGCLLIVVLLCGCSSNNDNDLISYMNAKEKIINNGAVLVDVRTNEEYNENHINGAINIDVSDINEDSISKIIFSMEAEIIVYSNNGNRSNQAKELLNEYGYSNVYDLGSINNWKE